MTAQELQKFQIDSIIPGGKLCSTAVLLRKDGIGAKTAEETDAGKKTNVIAYTKHEGRHLAELMAKVTIDRDL